MRAHRYAVRRGKFNRCPHDREITRMPAARNVCGCNQRHQFIVPTCTFAKVAIEIDG